MELRIGERLMLGALLQPFEGNVATLRIVRDLLGRLSPSDEEAKALKLSPIPGGVAYDVAVDAPVEIEISEVAMKIIKSALREANARRKLTLPQLDLYDRFVGDDADPDDQPRPAF